MPRAASVSVAWLWRSMARVAVGVLGIWDLFGVTLERSESFRVLAFLASD